LAAWWDISVIVLILQLKNAIPLGKSLETTKKAVCLVINPAAVQELLLAFGT